MNCKHVWTETNACNRVRGSNKIKVDSRNFSFFWMYQTGDVSTRKYNTKFGSMCEKKNSRTFSFTKMKKNGENLVFQKDFWSFKLKFKFNEKKKRRNKKTKLDNYLPAEEVLYYLPCQEIVFFCSLMATFFYAAYTNQYFFSFFDCIPCKYRRGYTLFAEQFYFCNADDAINTFLF